MNYEIAMAAYALGQWAVVVGFVLMALYPLTGGR